MPELCKLKGHTKEVNCCAFSNDYFVTCSGDKSVRVYQVGSFKELPYSPITAFKYGVNHVSFNADGTVLAAAGTDGNAHLFKLTDQEAKVFIIFRHSGTNTLQVCTFSNDSKFLVSGSADGSIAVWDVDKKKLIKEISGHAEGMVHAAAFTPCDLYLMTGSTLGDLRVWNMWNNTMQPVLLKQAHEDGVSSCGVSCIVFSPTFHSSVSDPQRCYLVASCGHDNKIKLWIFEVAGKSLRLFQTLSGHSGPVSGCDFSTSGKFLASSSFDKSIIIWDPIVCEQVFVLDAHSAFCTFVAYSVDDTYLASTSYDKTCIIWKMETEDANLPTLSYDSPEPQDTDLIQLNPMNQSNPQPQNAATQEPSSSNNMETQQRVPFRTWTCHDVSEWLTTELKLGQYSANFLDNEIDGAELTALTSDVLQKDLGVGPLGHRNKILRAIKAMNEVSSGTSRNTLNLKSLVQALPPSLQQLAPSVIQQFLTNSTPAESAPTSTSTREWQTVQSAPSFQNVRKDKEEAEKGIPDEFLCPITREIMTDPVIASDGFSYERLSIEAWMRKGKRSPMTNQPLTNKNLVPNQTLKMVIGQFMDARQPDNMVEPCVD